MKNCILETCHVCGGLVPRGPGYYNGIVVEEKLVCEGCALAIGIMRGAVTKEDGEKVERYRSAKKKDFANVVYDIPESLSPPSVDLIGKHNVTDLPNEP